jgi:hypothetical protein
LQYGNFYLTPPQNLGHLFFPGSGSGSGTPADNQPCGWYLFVNGPDVLLKVGLLRVDLLADVAGGGGELHAAQVRQLDVLGQVAELLAAVRAQRRFGQFAALASPPFSGQAGIDRLGRFFLQLVLISRRGNELYGFKE